MDKKKESQEIIEIIKDYKSSSNKDLKRVMDFVKEDFDITKEMIIKLTKHLDKLELTYNTIYKEYETRVNKK
jgi:BMFP domain-containing protein YqiC